MNVTAAYFDGQTSQRREVTLYGAGAYLHVSGPGVERRAKLSDVAVSERLGSAPRLIRFADGAFCEVRELDALQQLLDSLGHREAPVERWQRNVRAMAFSTLALLVLAVLAYVYGVPWAAARIAERLPETVDESLSKQTLAQLDEEILQPSHLPQARQEQIALGFARLRKPRELPYTLRFASSKLGANAFALPDGTVVLLDDLVKLCSNEEIYGVLGHELGHVRHRHGVRMLLQGSLVGLFATWWLGDVSTLLATGPALLLQARYSRAFEAEADEDAVLLLRANGLSPSVLADALDKLAKAAGEKSDPNWVDYLSSHPATRERLAALRAR